MKVSFQILEFSCKIFPTDARLTFVFIHVFTQRLNKKNAITTEKNIMFSLELGKLLHTHTLTPLYQPNIYRTYYLD